MNSGPALRSYRNTALKSTKATASANRGVIVCFAHIYNLDSTVNYLHLFDALVADVTVGTTVPTYTLAIPASGWIDTTNGDGIFRFSNGLTVAATTTIDGSAGVPTNGLLVNLGVRS